MGKNRKPTNLKILEGAQPCRINTSEPKSPQGLGSPPAWFGPLEIEAWADLKARLDEMGVSTRADEQAVALYCSHYANWRQATEALKRDGLTITDETTTEMTTRNGTRTTTRSTTRVHPMIKVANEATRQMHRLLSQMGMTPASRAGLHVQPAPEDDPLLAFFANRPPRLPPPPERKPRPKPPGKGGNEAG